MRLTPADIVNPSQKTGYDNVDEVTPGKFRARTGHTGAGPKTNAWRGPSRPSAALAAQDYCDRVNAGDVNRPAVLISAGHRARRAKVLHDQEVAHALGVLRDHRAQRAGKQGYVYLISDGTAVKIGYSVKPAARVAELQTGNPRELVMVGYKKGTEADEAQLHSKYIDNNLLQEWFRPDRSLLSEFGLTWQCDRRLTWMKNARRSA